MRTRSIEGRRSERRKKESGRRETIKAKNVALRESRIGASVEFILRQCFGVVFYRGRLFVLVGSSYSVDFALQFGKAWNRIFVDREFCNTFVLIRDSDVCLSVKKSLERTN